MAKHKVVVSIPQKVVLAKDVKFEIRSDDKKLGDLLVSKGNLEWFPTNNSVNKFRVSWERFDELMWEHGRQVKLKK